MKREFEPGEFNYVRAWDNLANPLFDRLPADMLALYDRVCTEADVLRQKHDLDMPWPVATDLQTAFRQADPAELARASRIVYFYGHWSYKGHSYRGNGGTWKFSLYADQTLREHLGLPERGRVPSDFGLTIELHQGMLRVCCSTPGSWQWTEMGLATADNRHSLSNLIQPAVLDHPVGNSTRAWHAWADRTVSRFDAWGRVLGTDPVVAGFITAGSDFKTPSAVTNG